MNNTFGTHRVRVEWYRYLVVFRGRGGVHARARVGPGRVEADARLINTTGSWLCVQAVSKQLGDSPFRDDRFSSGYTSRIWQDDDHCLPAADQRVAEWIRPISSKPLQLQERPAMESYLTMGTGSQDHHCYQKAYFLKSR